ncbi:unnamed protein product [Mytilus edulis]|uniref:Uncharacterized protein n=1 Tax=Mytilus edulis TaxID=6550 RepID=A0A8S3Q1L1_MYTED|nr:unnamed protein product [Mytilus edulis]
MTTRNKELSELKCRENSKYTKVRNNIIAHQKDLKNAVDQYIKELYYELDQSYNVIFQSIETDITAISTSIEKANCKLNEIDNFITKSEVADFFKNFKIFGEYAEIQQPKVKAIYQSMPNFIPGEIIKYRYNFGILQHDENSSVNGMNVTSFMQRTLQLTACMLPFYAKNITVNGMYVTSFMQRSIITLTTIEKQFLSEVLHECKPNIFME